jgi:hypothetical protein
LKQYADKFGVNHDSWWFLTGSKDSIYNFIFQELKVDKYDTEGSIDPNFAHTQRFVLIDKDFNVRGFYNGLDSASLGVLAKDVGLLMLEKSTNPEPLPFDARPNGDIFCNNIYSCCNYYIPYVQKKERRKKYLKHVTGKHKKERCKSKTIHLAFFNCNICGNSIAW